MAVHQDRAEKERGVKNKFIEWTISVWQSRSRQKLTSEDIRQITENTTGFFRILLEWEAKERALREREFEKLS